MIFKKELIKEIKDMLSFFKQKSILDLTNIVYLKHDKLYYVNSDFHISIDIPNINDEIAVNIDEFMKVISLLKKDTNIEILEKKLKLDNYLINLNEGYKEYIRRNINCDYIEKMYNDYSLVISKNHINQIINLHNFTAEKSQCRDFLKGIHVIYKNNKLYFEATNGAYLARYSYQNKEMNIDYIIPNEIFIFLSKIKYNNDLEIKYENKYFVAKLSNNIKIKSAFKEGRFPCIEDVLPNKYNVECIFNFKEIYDIVKDCNSILDKDSIGVLFNLKEKKVYALNKELQKISSYDLTVKSINIFNKEKFEEQYNIFLLNHKFLLNCLKQYEIYNPNIKTLIINYIDNERAFILGKEKGKEILLMPKRYEGE